MQGTAVSTDTSGSGYDEGGGSGNNGTREEKAAEKVPSDLGGNTPVRQYGVQTRTAHLFPVSIRLSFHLVWPPPYFDYTDRNTHIVMSEGLTQDTYTQLRTWAQENNFGLGVASLIMGGHAVFMYVPQFSKVREYVIFWLLLCKIKQTWAEQALSFVGETW